MARNRDLLVNRDGGLEGRLSKAFPHSIDISLHYDVRFFTALSLGILLDKSCLYLCLLVPKSAMNFFMQSLNFQLCMRMPLVLCEALAFTMRIYFQFRVRFHFVLALGFSNTERSCTTPYEDHSERPQLTFLFCLRLNVKQPHH